MSPGRSWRFMVSVRSYHLARFSGRVGDSCGSNEVSTCFQVDTSGTGVWRVSGGPAGGLERGGQVPGQQFSDVLNGMVGDLTEHRAQVEFWIEAVELGRADQRIDGGGPFAARVGAGEEIVFPAQGHTAQRPFGRVIVDLQQSIIDVTRERTPTRERVADGGSRFAFRRELAQRLFHPTSQVFEQGPGTRLADLAPDIDGLAANLFFNRIESADAVERFGCDRRRMRFMNLVELAPGVRPTGHFVDRAAVVKVMKARVGVGLQSALEVL